MAVIYGTQRDDLLHGTPDGDGIYGLLGNDYLGGDDSGDLLEAGGGNDTLWGGDGLDLLLGGAGFDIADYRGTPSGVSVDLARGLATLPSEPQPAETLSSIEGVFGGDHADTLTGNASANDLAGNAGNDVVSGGAGSDTLYGQSGSDTLRGDTGNDLFTAGELIGFDSDGYPVLTSDGVDLIDGGGGTDTIRLADMPSYEDDSGFVYSDYVSAYINLNLGTLRLNFEDTRDTLVSIENVVAGPGNDAINGSPANNRISTGDGANVVYAGGGDDTLIGGFVVDYHEGSGDILNGGSGDDVIRGGGSREEFKSTPYVTEHEIGHDRLVGGTGNDTIYGGAAVQTISGGSGADRIVLTDETVMGSDGFGTWIDFPNTTITDFNPGQGDELQFDFTEYTEQPITFIGESYEDPLDPYEMAFSRVDNENGGTDTVVRIQFYADQWVDMSLYVRLADYSGPFTESTFEFI